MSEASYTEVAASISAASVYDGSVEGVLDEDRLKCDRCGRLFNSQRGLSLHQRKAHALEYHLKHVPKVRKARWSHDERVLVAREEIRLLEVGVVNVNFKLAALFTQRSLVALKSVRLISLYAIGCRDVRQNSPCPPKPPALNLTTLRPDSRRHMNRPASWRR